MNCIFCGHIATWPMIIKDKKIPICSLCLLNEEHTKKKNQEKIAAVIGPALIVKKKRGRKKKVQ